MDLEQFATLDADGWRGEIRSFEQRGGVDHPEQRGGLVGFTADDYLSATNLELIDPGGRWQDAGQLAEHIHVGLGVVAELIQHEGALAGGLGFAIERGGTSRA